jgi:hypothetical protein
MDERLKKPEEMAVKKGNVAGVSLGFSYFVLFAF